MRHRLPIASSIASRSASANTDAKLVNCFVETLPDKQHKAVIKRPGLSVYSSVPPAPGLGIHAWGTDIYAVFGNTVYKNGVALAGTVDSSARYWFTEVPQSHDGSQPARLVMHNGVKAYTISTGGTITQITDPDLPFPLAAGIAYLDTYTCVLTPKAEVYNSNGGDPTNWNALNFLTAQLEPAPGVWIGKHLNYLMVITQWSTEFFYDAANPTGSPFARVDAAKLQFGSYSANSIVEIDGNKIWVARTRSGSPFVVFLEGMNPTPISTRPIERILDDADMNQLYAWGYRDYGHAFYVLSLKSENKTLVYDLHEKEWYFWNYNGGYFPFVGYAPTIEQKHLVQHESNGKIYSIDANNLDDAGTPITVEVVTPIYDGGTTDRKSISRIEIIGDTQPGSTVYLSCSDNDYASFGGTYPIDMSKERKYATRLGAFRRRAFRLQHTANTPLRMTYLQIDVEIESEDVQQDSSSSAVR